MLDMETLDTNTSTVILTIGAVSFDPLGSGIIERLELRPTMDEQTDIYKRTISEDTLVWWAGQNPDAINEAMGDHDRTPYKDCMEKLAKFCWNKKAIWSNGSVFDIMIAESAFKELGITCPWQFWAIRDCRTIYDLTDVSLKDGNHVTSHKAVEDAAHQAQVVQRSYQKLVNAGFTHLR